MIFSDLVKPKNIAVVIPPDPSVHQMAQKDAAARMIEAHANHSAQDLHNALSDWMDARDAQTQPKGDAPISSEPGLE